MTRMTENRWRTDAQIPVYCSMGILTFVVSVVMAILYPTLIHGQSTLVVKGGVNVTTFRGGIEDRYPVGGRTGVRLGGSAIFPVGGRFGFRLNGDYVQKGARDGFDDFIIGIDYVEFSGLADIALISPHRLLSLSLLAGPSVAFKVRSSRFWEGRFGINTLDFGIVGGIGIQMAISKAMTIRAELLYTEGIWNIATTRNYSVTNRSVVVQMGLGFLL